MLKEPILSLFKNAAEKVDFKVTENFDNIKDFLTLLIQDTSFDHNVKQELISDLLVSDLNKVTDNNLQLLMLKLMFQLKPDIGVYSNAKEFSYIKYNTVHGNKNTVTLNNVFSSWIYENAHTLTLFIEEHFEEVKETEFAKELIDFCVEEAGNKNKAYVKLFDNKKLFSALINKTYFVESLSQKLDDDIKSMENSSMQTSLNLLNSYITLFSKKELTNSQETKLLETVFNYHQQKTKKESFLDVESEERQYYNVLLMLNNPVIKQLLTTMDNPLFKKEYSLFDAYASFMMFNKSHYEEVKDIIDNHYFINFYIPIVMDSGNLANPPTLLLTNLKDKIKEYVNLLIENPSLLTNIEKHNFYIFQYVKNNKTAYKKVNFIDYIGFALQKSKVSNDYYIETIDTLTNLLKEHSFLSKLKKVDVGSLFKRHLKDKLC